MGIEGGYTEHGPKKQVATIEGEPVSSIVEISIDESEDIPLPPQIPWQDSRLVFEKVDQTYTFKRYGWPVTVPLYLAHFEFKDKKGRPKRINLTQTTRTRPCYFTGSSTGFYAHDPKMNGRDDNFYVIGVQPYELEDDQKHIAGVDHELGHAILMDEEADTKLFQAGISLSGDNLPEYAGIIRYANVLAAAIPERWRKQIKSDEVERTTLGEARKESHNVDLGVRLFHERYAWAAGINLSKRRQSPTGFERPSSVVDYAKFCLESYVRYYHDQRFVKGVKT